MVLKVFLSTAISGINDNDRDDYFEFIDKEIRKEYEGIQDDDVIEILSNFDAPPAPPMVKYPKLHHLEEAFNKMKDCDVFFLLAEHDGTIKPGCLVELNAWLTAKGPQPIVRWKLK